MRTLVLASLLAVGCAHTPPRPSVAVADLWQAHDYDHRRNGAVQATLDASVAEVFAGYPRAAPWDADWIVRAVLVHPLQLRQLGPIEVRFEVSERVTGRTVARVEGSLPREPHAANAALRALLARLAASLS